MKILHVNMDFLPSVGGAQMSVHQLALGQTQAGHDVSVLTNRKSARKMNGRLPYAVLPVFHRTSHMFRAPDSFVKRTFLTSSRGGIRVTGSSTFATCMALCQRVTSSRHFRLVGPKCS